MSLDSIAKRGASIDIAIPWRTWVAYPCGVVDYAARLSFVHYAIAGALDAVGGLACGSVYIMQALDGSVVLSQALSGSITVSEC